MKKNKLMKFISNPFFFPDLVGLVDLKGPQLPNVSSDLTSSQRLSPMCEFSTQSDQAKDLSVYDPGYWMGHKIPTLAFIWFKPFCYFFYTFSPKYATICLV